MDDFEGDLYRKEKVTVVTTSGVEVEAYVTFGTKDWRTWRKRIGVTRNLNQRDYRTVWIFTTAWSLYREHLRLVT
jgi:hypothetical protein